MSKPTLRSVVPWLIAGSILAFIGYKLHTSHFDWRGFEQSLRTADFRLVLLAIVVVVALNAFRAMRWSIFLRPAHRAAGQKPLPWWSLVGSQVVGFTGLVMLGRIAELIRPLLVARRTGLSFSSQIAVVTIERVFDLGAFALIFSVNLLLAPGLQTLPHHELFHRVGYAIAGMTIVLCSFVAAVRFSGTTVAFLLQKLLGLVSPSGGSAAGEKLLAFRDGLNVLDNLVDFFLATALSLGIWLGVALTYILTLKAFPGPVHALTVADVVLLMGFSVVGGIVQLPGVGGGAQALTIGALTQLFGIPATLAVSAGLMVWLTSSMSVVPFGLLYARIEGISIRQAARKSEEPLAAATPAA